MNKQKKSLGALVSRGYIFGLGAFRRYKEITGNDISHFEESLNGEVDDVEANYRWAVMLKCANDLYCSINNIDTLSVDHYLVLLNDADQSESDELLNQYLDSNYLGKPMREYYGIPKSKDDSKKKPSTPARRTRTHSK